MKRTSHSSKMEEECDETGQIVLKKVYGSRGHSVCEKNKSASNATQQSGDKRQKMYNRTYRMKGRIMWYQARRD